MGLRDAERANMLTENEALWLSRLDNIHPRRIINAAEFNLRYGKSTNYSIKIGDYMACDRCHLRLATYAEYGDDGRLLGPRHSTYIKSLSWLYPEHRCNNGNWAALHYRNGHPITQNK